MNVAWVSCEGCQEEGRLVHSIHVSKHDNVMNDGLGNQRRVCGVTNAIHS